MDAEYSDQRSEGKQNQDDEAGEGFDEDQLVRVFCRDRTRRVIKPECQSLSEAITKKKEMKHNDAQASPAGIKYMRRVGRVDRTAGREREMPGTRVLYTGKRAYFRPAICGRCLWMPCFWFQRQRSMPVIWPGATCDLL